jgi:hypothetical protein
MLHEQVPCACEARSGNGGGQALVGVDCNAIIGIITPCCLSLRPKLTALSAPDDGTCFFFFFLVPTLRLLI